MMIKKIRFLLLFLLVCLLAIYIYQLNKQKNTNDNEALQEEIGEIRDMTLAIDRAQWQSQHRECVVNDGAVMLDATLYLDEENRVRKLYVEGGSEDSSGSMTYYYSIAGKNRFTFETLSAVNGTRLELGIYFDKKGQKLYEDSRLLSGEGWAGGFKEKYLPTPKAYFSTLCEE